MLPQALAEVLCLIQAEYTTKITAYDLHDGGIYLHSIYAQGTRGAGLGTQAVLYFIHWCKAQGYSYISLTAMTPGTNHPELFNDYQRLTSWYIRLGFKSCYGPMFRLDLNEVID